jgi:hypothetical protein
MWPQLVISQYFLLDQGEQDGMLDIVRNLSFDGTPYLTVQSLDKLRDEKLLIVVRGLDGNLIRQLLKLRVILLDCPAA